MMDDKMQRGCLMMCMSLALVGVAGCTDSDSSQLVGVGSSTSVLAMQEWGKSLASQGVSLSYKSKGEELAEKELLDGSADFLLTTRRSLEDISQAKTRNKQAIISFPILAVHLALVHTQRGCDLAMSEEELREVFTGVITDFRAFGCAKERIQVLTREEDSGTRQNLYSYLGLDSLKGAKRVAHQKTAVIAPNMENVINTVPGALGYIPGPLVSFDNVFTIAIKDSKGVSHKPVIATQGSNRPIEYGKIQKSYNARESNEYPIVSRIYLILKANGNGKKLKAIKKFASFVVSHEAQANAESLGYIRLTSSQVRLANDKLKSIKE